MGEAKRAAVIYFPGRVDRKKLDAALQSTLQSLRWEPALWLPTSAEETGAIQAQRAAAQNATHLLVAGGDGTVREVLQSVVEHNLPVTVGILPVGTGNVLARNLNIDVTDFGGAVKRALLGNRHPIDMGVARIVLESGERREMLFSVMAGLGLDAKIMINTNPKLKRQIGWVAYIDGGLRALPTRFEKMLIEVDGKEPRRMKLVSLLIGNAGWLPGNINLMPDAKLDDGLLDAAVIGPRRFWNWIDFWSRVTVGNNVIRVNRVAKQLLEATANVKTLENLSGSKIRVTPDRPIHLQIDGDPLGLITQIEFEVKPRAVTVRI
jgi:diacylglycerol kinase family enzyme